MVAGTPAPPPITADQVEAAEGRQRRQRRTIPGLAELGVTPDDAVEAVLPTYLYRYRKGGQYADQDARETGRPGGALTAPSVSGGLRQRQQRQADPADRDPRHSRRAPGRGW